MSTITAIEAKSSAAPDEVREFAGKGHVDVVHVAGRECMRGTFEPGWRWSENVKPIAQTESCQATHFGYVESGAMTVQMDDGSSMDFKAGDFVSIPPGHDAFVDGAEACVMIDFGDISQYAKPHDN